MRIGVIGASGRQGRRYLDPANIPAGVECFPVARGELGDGEAVIVATPAATHCRITCAALAAGKHVLCEKPMALSCTDADRMFYTAKDYGRALLIAHTHLWSESFLALPPGPHATVVWRGEERHDCPAVLDWGAHAWSMALHLGTERVATGFGDRARNLVQTEHVVYRPSVYRGPDLTAESPPMRSMLETFACLVRGGQDWRADPEFALEVMRRCLG